ncbi:MAG: sensor domain-containing diguanylate cyclase [Spirochaetota bacterium]|nr:sensor domain-containing diguanylate cyclase [Spirochaetota bacterium]
MKADKELSKIDKLNNSEQIAAAKKEAKEQRKKNSELQEAFDRVSILNKIGRNITSSLDLETVMTTIYKNISSFISVDLFGIALYDKEYKEIRYKYFMTEGKRRIPEKISINTEGSMAAWVIKNRETLRINDVQNEYLEYVPKLIGTNKNTINSLIFVPLIINNNVTGIITIQSYKLKAYSDQHLEIIQAVGAYSAIALENSTVHEEINRLNIIINSEKKELERAYLKIDRLANHDILTSLPNRRLFAELLKQELRQADRQKTKTAVLFIDLDDFKPVNDKIGHDAGDKVLQMVAQRFISTLRESDAIARIGGDEFAAIICNVKNENDINRIAEKIITKFKNPFKIKNSKFQIGISMGISVYPDDDKTIDGLLKKADTAMYQIKSGKKNSFVFFNEIV